MLRERTDRAWFSCLLRHLARKWRGSILTTREPARDTETKSNMVKHHYRVDRNASCIWAIDSNRKQNTAEKNDPWRDQSMEWGRLKTRQNYTRLTTNPELPSPELLHDGQFWQQYLLHLCTTTANFINSFIFSNSTMLNWNISTEM